MRFLGYLFMSLAVCLLVLGCTQSSRESKAKMDEAKKKIGEATDATAEAAKAKRDDYARAMHKRLEELDAKYEDLKSRAAKADDQAKKSLQMKLDEAKVKRDLAAKKLDELKDASYDRWEKVKDGVGNAFDDLKKVFD
jgi:DNA anti-recombination protein RmuC